MILIIPNLRNDSFMDWESQCESAVGLLEAQHGLEPVPQLHALTQGISAGQRHTLPEGTSAGQEHTLPEGTSAGQGDARPQPPVWQGMWVFRLELNVQVQVEMASGPQGQ